MDKYIKRLTEAVEKGIQNAEIKTTKLLEAENKKLITLNNNFGNSYLEFLDVNYENIISKYYESGG